MKEQSKEVLDLIKDGLIVSCQALEDEPLFGSEIMAKLAVAAKQGGAVAIRANTVVDIVAIKQAVDLPIVGLIKRKYDHLDRYITPTLKEVKELVEIGVDIIAIDATKRYVDEKIDLKEMLDYIHENGKLAMADISTLAEGIEAEKLGFDIISTTMSGYTDYTELTKGPDVLLVKELLENVKTPVVAEGRISNENYFNQIASLKPHSIVIGGAITRPQAITKTFVELYNQNNNQ